MGNNPETEKNGWSWIDGIIVKNAALLFKWWRRFSVEGNSLWKRTICSIHRLEPEKSLIQQQNRVNNQGVWSTIMKVDK